MKTMWTSLEMCKFGLFFLIFVVVIAASEQGPMIDEHPQNATVLLGGSVVLRCKFSDIISKCVWSRNGHAITINDRYKYQQSETSGTNTSDCSIQINLFAQMDATAWYCACVVDSSMKDANEGCRSDSAHLTIETEAENPTRATQPPMTNTNDETQMNTTYRPNYRGNKPKSDLKQDSSIGRANIRNIGFLVLVVSIIASGILL